MTTKWISSIAATCALIWIGQAVALAANPTYTTIVVKNMHCAACAKKIAAKLYVVPGVLEVRADVKANTAYVIPQQKRRPSPRAIWEAVESAGFKPVKLTSASAQFKTKPAR